MIQKAKRSQGASTVSGAASYRLLFDKRSWARVGRIACASAVGLYVVVLLRAAWMSDDAYITLRTIDNFVNGHGLRWNVAERVQVFTHPLWLFLIAPVYLVTREAFYTTIVLSLLISIAAVLALVLYRRRDPWAGPILVTALLLALIPLVARLSR